MCFNLLLGFFMIYNILLEISKNKGKIKNKNYSKLTAEKQQFFNQKIKQKMHSKTTFIFLI
jgi:hypothetical protein